jgi:hypothetical protein
VSAVNSLYGTDFLLTLETSSPIHYNSVDKSSCASCCAYPANCEFLEASADFKIDGVSYLLFVLLINATNFAYASATRPVLFNSLRYWPVIKYSLKSGKLNRHCSVAFLYE